MQKNVNPTNSFIAVSRVSKHLEIFQSESPLLASGIQI